MKENEKKDKYLHFAREMNNLQRESEGDTKCRLDARYSHKIFDKGTGGHGNKMAIRVNTNYIIEIDLNNYDYYF